MSTARSAIICPPTRNAAGKINRVKNDESYDREELEWNTALLYITMVLLS